MAGGGHTWWQVGRDLAFILDPISWAGQNFDLHYLLRRHNSVQTLWGCCCIIQGKRKSLPLSCGSAAVTPNTHCMQCRHVSLPASVQVRTAHFISLFIPSQSEKFISLVIWGLGALLSSSLLMWRESHLITHRHDWNLILNKNPWACVFCLGEWFFFSETLPL